MPKGHKLDRSYAEPEPIEGARFIPVGHGKFAIIDEEDYERLSKRTWCIDAYGYAQTTSGKTKLKMHQVVMSGVNIDHINHDGLDNRKSNLRLATLHENMHNMKKYKTPTTSKYKGVSAHKASGKWQATIINNNKYIYLGLHETEESAAKAYDNKAIELFGEFAATNESLGFFIRAKKETK